MASSSALSCSNSFLAFSCAGTIVGWTNSKESNDMIKTEARNIVVALIVPFIPHSFVVLSSKLLPLALLISPLVQFSQNHLPEILLGFLKRHQLPAIDNS